MKGRRRKVARSRSPPPRTVHPGIAQDLRHHVTEQRLHPLHHDLVVGEGLVVLEHRELRVVGPIDPLVPEVLPDLVDPLEAPHDQPLQVELVRDPEVEGRVEGVVMRRKRPGRRAPVEGLEDRGLHLEEVPGIQELPNGPDHRGPLHEDLPHLGVDRQVGVPLPVAVSGGR
jgi:hypothetical protein